MPNIVITNTTPIVTLLGIGQLELLKNLYGQIIIPESVAKEVEQGKGKRFYADLSQLDWIKIQSIKETALFQYLLNDLDEGEAAVITLAQELNAQLLIIDERLGRRHAQLKGFVCIGTLGLLLKAKEKGFIPSIKPLLAKMQTNGIWLEATLIEQILTKANEN
jgi:predicted nucleic acid-binding protein